MPADNVVRTEAEMVKSDADNDARASIVLVVQLLI